ncbi:hypothetical protein CC1G_12441 [Coprinopsis cinerea okayama7|uniref:F-box domain-containing protein n=1 Tax=Coprinopsis cinerea (strain Okayama-7 / 130 / ATCC MYA-4618 / FGSC 9003) TaxID=240176 RepID=A8NST4_COPC7|nr:hypothetical protein CC1G_12441 [Coprinopsis cinerea okayama7\|eukprot:XP_001836089.1 hypothetical protein CC1G_12441 [Coprinopsis cinerea okayama7\
MSLPQPQPAIYSLPNETLVEIAEKVYYEQSQILLRGDPNSNMDITNCSLVSRQFSAVFRPLAFRTIYLHPHNVHCAVSDRPIHVLLGRLSVLLNRNPEIGGWIRELQVRVDDRDAEAMIRKDDYSSFVDVLDKATALTSFGFVGGPMPFWGSLDQDIRAALQRVFQMKTLEKLEIGGSMVPLRILLSMSPVRDLVLVGCRVVQRDNAAEKLDESMESVQATRLRTLRCQVNSVAHLPHFRSAPEAFAQLRVLTAIVGLGNLHPGAEQIQAI